MSPDTHDDGQPTPEQVNSELACRLLAHVFHEKFCVQEEIADAQKSGVLPAYFFGWCHKHMDLMSKDDVCHEANVGPDIWDGVMTLLHSGLAAEQTAQVWYQVVLGRRPNPKVPVATINMIVNVTFDDGSVLCSQRFVSKEMVDDIANGLNDPIALSVLSYNLKGMVEQLAAQGLDSLHADAKKYAWTSQEPEDPYDVAMGLILSNIPQLKPGLQDPVKNFMRLAQQCIRPPIPPHVLQAYRGRMMKAKAVADGKPRGGWNA